MEEYINRDILHNWMNQDKRFGDFSYYKQKGNMTVETVKLPPAFPGVKSLAVKRYWKFFKVADGTWSVYEIDMTGKQIRNSFELTEYVETIC